MRASILITILLILNLPVISQQNQIITAVPNLEISDLRLADQNGNNTIEANESCELLFSLKNAGGQPARTVRVKLSLIHPADLDIKYRKNRTISTIKSKSRQEIKFPMIAGDSIPKGIAEFKIEISELNGFDAYPAQVEIKTAQGNLIKKALSDNSMADMEDSTSISNFKLVDLHYTDHNKNEKLEAFETSHLEVRIFNYADKRFKEVTLFIKPIEGKSTGIGFPRSTSLGTFHPFDYKDISIPIQGKKNISDGQVEFKVYVLEEGVNEPNYQILKLNTLKYEEPVLKIGKTEFSGLNGDELKLNDPINFTVEIVNTGTGTAFDIEVEPRVTNENVKILSKTKISIDTIPGGESREIQFQFLATKKYIFPLLSIRLEVTENFNDLFMAEMMTTAIQIPEEKKIEPSESSPATAEKEFKPQQEVIETVVTPVTFPKLQLHSQQFADEDKNNVINYKESCRIKFKVSNTGSGIAENIAVKVKQLNSAITGLSFPESISLGDLGPNQESEVDIHIKSTGLLPSDLAEFRIDVVESNGYNATALLFKVRTQKLLEPFLSIRSAGFMSNSGQLRRNEQIELKLTLENKGPGDASDVKIQFEYPDFPSGLLPLGDGIDEFEVKKLKRGESRDFSLLFITNRSYFKDQIPVEVKISESLKKYGIDTVLVGELISEAHALIVYEVQPTIIEQAGIIEQPSDMDQMEDNQVVKIRGGGDPLKGLGFDEAEKEMKIGKYFAFIIGIDNYSGVWKPLENAVNDAKAVEDLLRSNYNFEITHSLYNSLATRENIIRQLEWYERNVTENDNLLIFYSGHGEFKEEYNKGYWVPVEAKTKSTFEYISNSDLQTFLTSIKSKHTLLISDACFSGDIFNTRGETTIIPFENTARYYRNAHKKISRKAITSGGVEPVWDGGSEGHSVFTYYLLKILGTNPDRFFDASQLYEDLRIPVENNSRQSPVFLPIMNAGDEGGQFIFIQK